MAVEKWTPLAAVTTLSCPVLGVAPTPPGSATCPTSASVMAESVSSLCIRHHDVFAKGGVQCRRAPARVPSPSCSRINDTPSHSDNAVNARVISALKLPVGVLPEMSRAETSRELKHERSAPQAPLVAAAAAKHWYPAPDPHAAVPRVSRWLRAKYSRQTGRERQRLPASSR